MPRITGYGQSGRIEWDMPVEFYLLRKGETGTEYIGRMTAGLTDRERRILVTAWATKECFSSQQVKSRDFVLSLLRRPEISLFDPGDSQ